MATGDSTANAQAHIDVGVAQGGGGSSSPAYIPILWSKSAIVARERQLVFANLVNRVFESDAANYGNVVHVPSVSNLSVQAKSTTANAATVFETVEENNTDITIDCWEYSAIAVETATRRLANKDMLKLYSGKQGYALALSVDYALAAYVDNLTNNVGTANVPLAFDDFLRSRQYLDDADVPADDRAAVVSPAQERGFLQLDQFVHRDYELIHGTSQNSALNKAYMGTVMDVPIYKTTHTEACSSGHDNVMLHKEAIALVMALEAVTHTMFDINYLANKVVVEQLYGSAIMRNDHGVYMKGL